MKYRINKALLADLPPPVARVVADWQAEHRKTYISIEDTAQFYVQEDARFHAINLATGASCQVRAGGEWAGVTNLMPGGRCALPANNVVVATGFFCGEPWLTIYHNSKCDGVTLPPGELTALN